MTMEVLIVSALLLVALENTMAAVSANSNLSGHQQRMTEVVHVGQSLMEELMGAYDTDLDMAPGAHAADFDAEANRVAGGMYTANWTITQDAPYPGIRTIQITLTWDEMGRSRSTEFTTYRN